MTIFMFAAQMDKGTVMKLITAAHFSCWYVVRDDLIETYKHTFTDAELKRVLEMVEGTVIHD